MSPKTIFLALLLWIGAAFSTQAWWDEEWTVRKKITLDTSSIAEPIGTATVLIRLHDGTYQFMAGKEDGSDMRFLAADEKTVLPHHVEKYDGLLNEAFVWVKVPDVAPGAKVDLWLYYGNTGPKAVKTEDAKASFAADTLLVYHFGEKGQGPADVSGQGHSGKNAVAPVEGALIGSGARFDGKTFLTTETSAALTWAQGEKFTWSVWLKPAALAPQATVFSRREGNNSFVVSLDNGVPYVDVSGTRTSPGAPLVINAWRHLAVVADGAKVSLYLDGELYSAVAAAVPALNTSLQLGGEETGTGFTGEVDELQLSRGVRPVGWLKLAALSQGAADKAGKLLVMTPDEESGGGGHSGYFTIILSNLTFDGWVVIGILGVMFVISWWLMFTKIAYLNSLAKGNAMFMKEWEHVATDLTALDHGDPEKVKTLGGRATTAAQQRHLSRASVYRLYHLGAQEIRHRMQNTNGQRILSSRSIQSIRATMDGGQVREKQRIDKLIVLLTICISGGPFLGLLGTVVGVMITFAAVAAAGEVNVNAIAPGIAAALLATVAGLAVAIPALFGYNYILARVKDATADMHLFNDEFVTKMAEFYSEGTPANRNRPYNAPPAPEMEAY